MEYDGWGNAILLFTPNTSASPDKGQANDHRIYELHQDVLEQYDYETRVEEKKRMAYVMKQQLADLKTIEKELSALNH
ncbi:MAG: hypothetical protein QJT81_00315 [Candidatus Thiothrix putei]|uniref:Uncharacterized protein n=1 Tax=Candidatus Thiothrix putei TaxID=3080811 RepID=A0AA95HBS7_9GAMM|nr:MAG: hypothetical protein QJT81_00315 [Candidatus Thiothrix putei]